MRRPLSALSLSLLLVVGLALCVARCVSVQFYEGTAHGGIDCNPKEGKELDPRCPPPDPPQPQSEPHFPNCVESAHEPNPDQRCVASVKSYKFRGVPQCAWP